MRLSIFELLTAIRNIFAIILINDYFKRNYPQQYEAFIINASYKLIYFYSKCQIIYIKFYNKIKSYIDTIPKTKPTTIKNIIKNDICHYINGEKHNSFIADSILEQFVVYDLLKEDENSIYIYSDYFQPIEDNCINKVIISENPVSLIYDISNIKFMLLEVKVNDNMYKINLKSDTYNYYIDGNILNRQFFIYYLKTYYSEQITKELNKNYYFPDILHIKLIDQDINVKELEITNSKHIILYKDSYIYK